MNIRINPFQQLYVADDAYSARTFVDLFSNEVLQSAVNPVFQGGNVVLSGTQGCGKTMILNLLLPETRIAYARVGRPFPVQNAGPFLSAGVNLTRSRVADIIQVTLGEAERDEREMPLFFADYFNFLVVENLLASLECVGRNPDIFEGIVLSDKLDAFATVLCRHECWFGSLEGVATFEALKARVAKRVTAYRSWVNGNLISDELPFEITRSKTTVGEPVGVAADCLRSCGALRPEVPVLIRVDQIEELHRAFPSRQATLLLGFRTMLNRAFAARDSRVHYRVGTRLYGWENLDFLRIWGSGAHLEKKRDYHLIEMDSELFLQGETKNSVFHRFCVDAFQRRVTHFLPDEHNVSQQLARLAFGKSPTAAERLEQLSRAATTSQTDRALGLDRAEEAGKWTTEWLHFLRHLYSSGGYAEMLDAVLAAAWGRQTGGGNSIVEHRESPPPSDSPWRDRKWWRKERLDLAVLQLSTRSQQRFMWWGFEDIRSLSGGNITVFFHLCHRIWDGFLKNESSLSPEKRTDVLRGGSINRNVQSAGILFASNEWFNKLVEEPGGNTRRAFVEKLGVLLNSQLMADLAMSYPGGNGISLATSDFFAETKAVKSLRDFVREAVGFGALVEVPHTSKSKAGGNRRKFYLNPVLCPRFQIPEARTKEPLYWTLQALFDLARSAKVTIPAMPGPVSVTEQFSLFDEG